MSFQFLNEKVLLSAMPPLSSKLNRMLSEVKVVTFMRNRKTHTLILASIRTAYAILKKERCYIYTKILILANDDNHHIMVLNTRTTSRRAVQKYFRSVAESRCLLSLLITNRMWLKEKSINDKDQPVGSMSDKFDGVGNEKGRRCDICTDIT